MFLCSVVALRFVGEIVCGGRGEWEDPSRVSCFIKWTTSWFWQRKEGQSSSGCIVLAVVLVLLMENRRNFEYYRGKGWRSFRIEQDHEIYLFLIIIIIIF